MHKNVFQLRHFIKFNLSVVIKYINMTTLSKKNVFRSYSCHHLISQSLGSAGKWQNARNEKSQKLEQHIAWNWRKNDNFISLKDCWLCSCVPVVYVSQKSSICIHAHWKKVGGEHIFFFIWWVTTFGLIVITRGCTTGLLKWDPAYLSVS